MSAFHPIRTPDTQARLRPIADISPLRQHRPMKRITLTTAATVMLLHPTIAATAGMSPSGPAKLEGMEYLEARKVILGYGWRPSNGDCGGPDVDEQTCAKYPEIDHCTGVGIGLCGMEFVRRDRCLILITIGGAPQDQPGDTLVRDVTFLRGPCPSG